jgi:hypothetical protein
MLDSRVGDEERRKKRKEKEKGIIIKMDGIMDGRMDLICRCFWAVPPALRLLSLSRRPPLLSCPPDVK